MTNDANDIKTLEKKIKELEKKNHELNGIIGNAPIPIFVLDKNHKITHFNKACEELTGLSCEK
ncbi:MAG: PAS domain-containing protein, partial [Proteobacteria bacterium]|nr:PAS domain-containing protein [Pseudomonadota bacterium]